MKNRNENNYDIRKCGNTLVEYQALRECAISRHPFYKDNIKNKMLQRYENTKVKKQNQKNIRIRNNIKNKMLQRYESTKVKKQNQKNVI